MDKQSITNAVSRLTAKQTVCLLLGTFVAYRTLQWGSWKVKNSRLQALASKTLQDRNAKNTKFDVSGVDVEHVLSLDLTQLRRELIAGKVTSVQLVHVFGERCQTIGRKLCLSTEECFGPALVMAAEKDREREEAIANGKQEELPLMHGVPISVKDMLAQKGYLATVGCAYRCDEKYRCTEDSVVVSQLLKAGAIPIVRGNVPQMALSFHTNNYIWGEALCPLDQDRSCGGSSGGDAGLVLARCVPWAVGSDIGGSLRFPAAFCGIFGFKPTQNRLSKKGNVTAITANYSHFLHMKGTVGPMGLTTDDLVVGMKVFADPDVSKLDPFTAPSPWRDQDFLKVQDQQNIPKIKIGILKESSFLPCSASVKRAMKLAEKAARDLGYDVVEYSYPAEVWRESTDLFIGIMANGDVPTLIEDLDDVGESWLPAMAKHRAMVKFGPVMRWIVDNVILPIKREKRLGRLLQYARQQNPRQFAAFLQRRNEFCCQLAREWQEAGLTALISPIWPHCGPKNIDVYDMGILCEYSFMWNLTGQPAGIMPVTTVLESETTYTDTYNDRLTEVLSSSSQGSAGMPVSIQVVGAAYEDEQALGIMKKLEKQIGFKIKSAKELKLN